MARNEFQFKLLLTIDADNKDEAMAMAGVVIREAALVGRDMRYSMKQLITFNDKETIDET